MRHPSHIAIATVAVLTVAGGALSSACADDDFSIFDDRLIQPSGFATVDNCVPRPLTGGPCTPPQQYDPTPAPPPEPVPFSNEPEPFVRPTDPSPAPQTPSPSPQPQSNAFSGQFQSGSLGASRSVAASGGMGAGGVGGGAVGGYINPAPVMNMFRLRYDAAYNNSTPDRAEFFYPLCGCGGGPGPGILNDPTTLNTDVDFQELHAYIELAPSDVFSVFFDLPIRSLDPNATSNTTGIGDIQAGFKAALLADERQYLTFLLRFTMPTGDGRSGTGTEHLSIEPGLLYMNRLTDRLTLEAELIDWIPVDGTRTIQGNVLRYGAGLGYTIVDECNYRVTPIAEFVAWSVLDGRVTNPNPAIVDARTTIVNGKFGARIGFGRRRGAISDQSVYIGYGRALTGTAWYEEIVRAEYRVIF